MQRRGFVRTLAGLSLWPGHETQTGWDAIATAFDVAAGNIKHAPDIPEAPRQWRQWLRSLFPAYVRAPFAPHHELFWEWVWAIELDSDPRPFVGIWPRGGAKSTSAELGSVALGVRGRRRYALYARDTQDRADDSVSNIGALLESESIARFYPEHNKRDVNKYGSPQGWRRNRLWTSGGFVVDALGLDVASRGKKLLEQRPDLIIFDDIDGRHDSPRETEKKLTTIKESILPAGTPNCAVISIQNLIIQNGVFARLADGRADFLTRRVLSGPIPALRDMKVDRVPDKETGRVRAVIIAGTPTWAGQDRVKCQQLVDRIGLASFDREAQHNVQERIGALWTKKIIEKTRRSACPPLKRVVVGVDPSGGGAEIGIIVGGLGYDNHVYLFADKTQPGALGPHNWGRATADAYHDAKADTTVAEANFGGDMVKANIKVIDPTVTVKIVYASRGKAQRAEPVASAYVEDERVHHVGVFPELEAEMTGWVPGDPHSPNRLDAAVWVVTELLLKPAEAETNLDLRKWRVVGAHA